jgi:hypothetical protein
VSTDCGGVALFGSLTEADEFSTQNQPSRSGKGILSPIAGTWQPLLAAALAFAVPQELSFVQSLYVG